MKQLFLTLHGPRGGLSHFDLEEAHFLLGTGEASDELWVEGEGIEPRHAWVWIAEARMQVEDLAGGALVNERPIEPVMPGRRWRGSRFRLR